MNQEKNISRREFIQQSAVLGTGVMLAGANGLFAEENLERNMLKNIASKGYAARDSSGKLSPWSFERRPLGDNDIMMDIKFCGVCHSDIHQLRGEWGPQQYPQVPGHEITGVVAAVGKNVTKFKVGDQAGVGTMVDGCGTCDSCRRGGEQYCDDVLFTYGSPDKTSPTSITQGGYSNNIVVKEYFAIKIPKTIWLQDAASLLCADITTYSPLVRHSIREGDRVGVAGIGGLGHLAVKLAVAQGAEVYAFTTSPSKQEDILAFGAKEVIAEAGASVALADIHEEVVRAAAEELVAGGRKALAVRCDVTDDTQVASMIDRTVSTFGRLDAAFNNAGVEQPITATADLTEAAVHWRHHRRGAEGNRAGAHWQDGNARRDRRCRPLVLFGCGRLRRRTRHGCRRRPNGLTVARTNTLTNVKEESDYEPVF